jgi:hypothetical protein
VPEVIILPELWRKTSGIVPDCPHALVVVGESGTTYKINFSTSDNPDQTVVICHISKSLSAEARAAQMAVLDLMRSMMRGLAGSVYISCSVAVMARKDPSESTSFKGLPEVDDFGDRPALLLAFADWLRRITERNNGPYFQFIRDAQDRKRRSFPSLRQLPAVPT